MPNTTQLTAKKHSLFVTEFGGDKLSEFNPDFKGITNRHLSQFTTITKGKMNTPAHIPKAIEISGLWHAQFIP